MKNQFVRFILDEPSAEDKINELITTENEAGSVLKNIKHCTYPEYVKDEEDLSTFFILLFEYEE
jgi:hypothetical protein